MRVFIESTAHTFAMILNMRALRTMAASLVCEEFTNLFPVIIIVIFYVAFLAVAVALKTVVIF